MDLSVTFPEYSLAWLLFTTLISFLSGFFSSWLTYFFIKRKELEEIKRLELKKSRADRITREIIKWANPIHRTVIDLSNRLDNILYNDGYLALNQNFIHPQWSITYDYSKYPDCRLG
jgi:hypothetical protein